jgi:hypothetical protein
MDRRSFLIGLGSTGLIAGIPSGLNGLKADDLKGGASYWDALDREEKMLRMAERVVPGTGLEQLTITPADLNGAAPVYERYQSESEGTPFVNWVTESDITVSPSDMAVRAYAITEEDRAGPGYPHYIDEVVIAIPAGETDELVSAVKSWEDCARAQGTGDKSEGTLAHNRGLSRYLTFMHPRGYRIQRIRILGDRMLVAWVEGVYGDEESCFPLLVGQQIENEILLRRVRTYLNAGNNIPEEPIVLERSRWRK